jgi:hypothetical protein
MSDRNNKRKAPMNRQAPKTRKTRNIPQKSTSTSTNEENLEKKEQVFTLRLNVTMILFMFDGNRKMR